MEVIHYEFNNLHLLSRLMSKCRMHKMIMLSDRAYAQFIIYTVYEEVEDDPQIPSGYEHM